MSIGIIIVLSLLFSAFFSGMEIAFVSANKLRLELDKKQANIPSRILSVFTKYPSNFIATMLIGNNIALVIYGISMSELLEPWFKTYISSDAGVLFVQTIFSTIIILLTAEFLPKTVFRINPNTSLSFFSVPLILFYGIFYPISKFSIFLSNTFLKRIFRVNISEENSKSVFEKVDLSNLVNEHQDAPQSNEEVDNDIRIFQNALDFSKVKVRECMIPRPELVAVDVNTEIKELKNEFIETGRTRILVYEENIDKILGYISSKRLFKRPEQIRPLIKSLPFVPETMLANRLLKEFIAKQNNMAVVVDEFGGTAGLVTLEDLIEEIFGEIQDEHDDYELTAKQISDNEYEFSGRLEIDHINEKFDLHFPENEEYETLAGYILHHNENIPSKGEIIVIGQFEFKILELNNTRIELIHLRIKPE